MNSPFALFNRLVFSSIFPHSLLLCDFCFNQFSFFVLVLWQDSSIFLMHACCNCVTSPIFPVCCLVCVFIICPQHVRFVTFIFDLSIFLMHVCDFWRGVRSCVQCGCTVLAKHLKIACLGGHESGFPDFGRSCMPSYWHKVNFKARPETLGYNGSN